MLGLDLNQPIDLCIKGPGPLGPTAMRPPSPSIPEKDFFFAALDQALRLDGRDFLEARPHALSFGTELGHVECSLGKTR
jgi:exosome complex RNA-binding protein Rrp42 (RNase PH superfamily)